MSDFLVILIWIAILVGLFFSFKYFAKTTTIILLLLITWGLIWDYQVSKFPAYDISTVPQWYFDQQRNIIPEDQDQYIKLLKVISDYSLVVSGPKSDSWGEQPKINENIARYNKLKNDYANALNKTGLELNSLFKNNSINILSFEKELLKNTNISSLEWVLSTWAWWDLDPSRDIESLINDPWEWSQNLVRNLTMIWWVYCYMYSLQQTWIVNELLEQKCVSYFDEASKITYRQYDRKWSLISKLVTLVNARIVLSSLNNFNFEKTPMSLKEKVRENLKFLWDTSQEEFIKNYKVDEYNTAFSSAINQVISEIISKKWVSNSVLVSSALSRVNSETISKTKKQSFELWKYFFMFEDADKPINDLWYFLWRYEKSPSRYLLSILSLDRWEFISTSLSAELMFTLVPRLTWIERNFKEVKNIYLQYTK